MEAIIWQNILVSVAEEADRAREKFGYFSSLREAYAVLLEKVDELWCEVKKKQSVEVEYEVHGDLIAGEKKLRNAEQIRIEAIQIAGIALRIAADAERLARK